MPRAPLPERLTAQALAGEPLRSPDGGRRAVAGGAGAGPARCPAGGAGADQRASTATDVDRALSEDRSLLITWLNRGTLHLVRSEDYPWLHALTAPTHFASCRRRLQQEGMSEREGERAMQAIEKALAEEGPLSGKDLRGRLEAAGHPDRGPGSSST